MATPKTEATQDTKKMMIAAQAKLKNSSDTGSWGTSCLSPPLNSGDGLMYKNPTTGEEVRVMPNPGRTPYRGEPPAKFDNDWYYRYRSGSDQTWGPHTTLPDK